MDKNYFYIVLTCFNSAGFRKGYKGVGLKACNILTVSQPWLFHLLRYLFSLLIIKL